MFFCGIFGFIGYIFSAYNDLDISYGIIWGCVFALGVAILETLNIGNTITSIIYIVVYFLAIQLLPTLVGAIILLLVPALYIVLFINIKTRDRTDEINKIYNNKNCSNAPKIKDIIARANENKIIEDDDDMFEDSEVQKYEEQCECERCFKIISEEEYELHDGLCEECFIEVHTDKNGHFRDGQYFD